MKKLIKWLFVKETKETVEVPTWTFEKTHQNLVEIVTTKFTDWETH